MDQIIRLKSAACYFPILGFLYSFYIVLKGDDNKLVKFHAAQCSLIGAWFIWIALALMLWIVVGSGFVGIYMEFPSVLVYKAIILFGLLLCFNLMVKAYVGKFKLPLIGKFAERYLKVEPLLFGLKPEHNLEEN
jgi:uncharacterized membrane protein